MHSAQYSPKWNSVVGNNFQCWDLSASAQNWAIHLAVKKCVLASKRAIKKSQPRMNQFLNEKDLLKIIFFPSSTHYSKSQIFVQKFNFDKTPTFSRVFHPNFFLIIFLVKSKLSTAKKSKTTTFTRVFHPKKNSCEIKVEFLDKIWRFQTVQLGVLFC